jgi:hypothetical protein
MNIFNTIKEIVVAGLIAVTGFFGLGPNANIEEPVEVVEQAPSEILGASTQQVAGTVYYLAGSGVSSSATSITLTSLTIPQSGYEILDADVSDTFYVTLEPGSVLKQEIVSCTTITQNVNNTATLSGCTRGLLPISPYTATSTLQFAHAGGSKVIFSNAPQVYEQYAALNNSQTVTGYWTGPTPVTSGGFATKGYVDGLAIGTSTVSATEIATGFVELATGQEAASSTSTGGTGARLALPASIATSTASSGHHVVVTDINGKINNFIDNQTFASLTLTGTTTFAGYSSSPTAVVRTYNLADSPATWTKPSNLSHILVELWGAGGSGAGAVLSIDNSGGGGGGAYVSKIIYASSLSATTTVTIGAGGSGVTVGGGGAGGNTTFGALLTGYGGGGGQTSSGGATGGGGGDMFAAGTVGASTKFGGTFGPSSAPFTGGSSVYSGGGAGADDTASGNGGFSVYGGGGGGSTGNSAGSGGSSFFGGNGGAANESGSATAGSVPGGGGGGSTTGTSGAGGSGRAVITEYYN